MIYLYTVSIGRATRSTTISFDEACTLISNILVKSRMNSKDRKNLIN